MAYLRMEGITKFFAASGVLANDAVDLVVEEGEIHAVIGENGAGKSTLMKLLYGLEHADAGEITFRGEKVAIKDPFVANRLGIGMVHQHFKLVSDFTVAENVVLGSEPRARGPFIDRRSAVRDVSKVIEEHGFSVDAKRKVQDLTVGQMQQVEIVKMLYRNAELLILDEPTSVLTEQEIESLFNTLKNLLGRGKTIILITHKLEEVMQMSDRVTVMRDGKVVAVRDTKDVDKRELSRLMVGRDILLEVDRKPPTYGDPVLELKDVTIRCRGQGRPLLDRISFQVRSGELVGIAGVGGNGLAEIEDVIGGLRRATSGRIFLHGEDVTALGPEPLREVGLAYVPADRLRRGASLPTTVRENCIVTKHHDFLRTGILQKRGIRAFTERLIEHFSIDAVEGMPAGNLSGGNIQKMILARELAAETDFILFSEPTWGLDIASSQFVYEKMLELRQRGAGVLLISSNLDEILGLADTVLIMYRGRIVGRLENTESLSKEIIGEYMLGLRDDSQSPSAVASAEGSRG
ncbi:MAG: ABC transporter ATP-binding protein [Candidatus Bipolaricaulota bacterium]|nr:MAG: ABC transporter ATP-binding protein [Candidatus Bipolaricaulota bacterium]